MHRDLQAGDSVSLSTPLNSECLLLSIHQATKDPCQQILAVQCNCLRILEYRLVGVPLNGRKSHNIEKVWIHVENNILSSRNVGLDRVKKCPTCTCQCFPYISPVALSIEHSFNEFTAWSGNIHSRPSHYINPSHSIISGIHHEILRWCQVFLHLPCFFANTGGYSAWIQNVWRGQYPCEHIITAYPSHEVNID